jgi:hypothetical protein
VNDPRLAFHRTGPLTGRARLLRPQQRGLLFEEFFDGPLGHDASGVLGESLDLVGIEVEIGTNLLLDPTSHDFSPSLSDLSDARRID